MKTRSRDLSPNGEERAWALEAVAGISDGLVVIDASPRLIYRNPAAERLLGADPLSEDVRRWPREFGIYLPDERTPLPSSSMALLRALEGEEVHDLDVFLRNPSVPNGVHVRVNGTALRDETGKIRGAAVTFRDVTLLRKHEAHLREAERQKKAILDNIPSIAWLKDEEGRLLVVNQRYAEAAGRRSPAELTGLTDADIWPPELATRYREGDARVLLSDAPVAFEEPFVDAGGRRRWIETVKMRIVDDAGKPIGTTGIAHDITARKEAEDALRSNRDELERRVHERTAELARAQENLVRQERLAVLGQLAGGVAHQIRNPLAAIMNATYVLRRHLPPDLHPNVEDAIRIIHDEIRHANIIITGLLDYARVRSPDRYPTSLGDVLERVLSADWIPSSIDVVRHLPADDVMCEADADQLHGAVANVVRNAVEAMPDGGVLRVTLTRTADEARITIADTGTGISPQVSGHLFEPLQSSKPLGVGLGLVTARRFVEAHGGTIASIDAPSGACFEIVLPLT